MFIRIIEDEAGTFPYHFTDPDTGRRMESEFTLRLVPDREQSRLREQYTSRGWKRGQRVETVDWEGFVRDCIDYAIVGWKQIKAFGSDADLPCERKYKLLLPEKVKGDIIKVCVGKDLSELQPHASNDDDSMEAVDPKKP